MGKLSAQTRVLAHQRVFVFYEQSQSTVCVSSSLADVSRTTDHKCDGGKPAGQRGQLVPEGQEAVQDPHRDPLQVSR